MELYFTAFLAFDAWLILEGASIHWGRNRQRCYFIQCYPSGVFFSVLSWIKHDDNLNWKDFIGLYLSLVILCSICFLCFVVWGEVGRVVPTAGEISLTPCLKAVLFQCWLGSFTVIMVFQVGSTVKKRSYFWWFFSECFSSLLLLSCASKHTSLSVKTENQATCCCSLTLQGDYQVEDIMVPRNERQFYLYL